MSATALSAPGTKSGRLQRACLDVLRQYEAAGVLQTSSRFVYYELKQAGYPLARHARRRDDQDVIDAVKRLRDAGLWPWEGISDETRSVEGPHLASSIRQWVLDVLGQGRAVTGDRLIRRLAAGRRAAGRRHRRRRAAAGDGLWHGAGRAGGDNGCG